jgi:hypothetical protein
VKKAKEVITPAPSEAAPPPAAEVSPTQDRGAYTSPAVHLSPVMWSTDPWSAGAPQRPPVREYVRSLEAFSDGNGPYGAHAAHALMRK